jgi:hypothetical protein
MSQAVALVDGRMEWTVSGRPCPSIQYPMATVALTVSGASRLARIASARSAREMRELPRRLASLAWRQVPVRGPLVSRGGRRIVQSVPLRLVVSSIAAMSA